MRSRLGLALAAVLASAAPAYGQAQEAPQTSAPQPPSGPITDAEVASFARATVKLHALGQPTPEQMGEAITGAGLAVERYNEIATRMQGDADFRARVNSELVRAQSQAQAARPASGAHPPAPPPPPLPTSGPAGQVLGALDRICIPMVRRDLAVGEVAPQLGFKRDRRDGSFSAVLGQRPFRLTVLPRGANQAVCNVEIRHPLNSGEDIARALNVWAMHQRPEFKPARNDVGVGADGLKRTTLSWEQASDGRTAALVFVRVQRADGSPVDRNAASATLLYSEQPA